MTKELTELEQEELEAKRLQNALARLQLAELQAQVESKTNAKKRGAIDARKAIEDMQARKARCNHHVGGKGPEAVHFGQGDEDRPFCIGGQVMLDDRIRLVCGRCGDDCWSDSPDKARWGMWSKMWRKSINQELMIVGGLKQVRQQAIA